MIDRCHLDLSKGIYAVREEPNDEGGTYFEIGPGGEFASADATPSEENGSSLVLGSLVVTKGIRGLGIGRQLFDHIVDHARTEGFKQIEAEVNNDRLAKIINTSFSSAKIQANAYDSSKPIPKQEEMTLDEVNAFLGQERAKMPKDSRPDDMLNSSVYYTINLK